LDFTESYRTTFILIGRRMKITQLQFTKQTSIVALVIFVIYTYYGIFYLPFTQFLVSLAVGGIAYGISGSYEVALLGLLLMSMLYPMFGGPVSVVKTNEGFMNASAEEVSKRVIEMKKAKEVSGVGSPMTEGFEDAKQDNMNLDANKKESENSDAVTAESKPSEVEEKKEEGEEKKATAETFQDNGALFKLGQMPSDTKGGFHMDVGTTVMNALNSLKPDQIKAMTTDTKQLIETQKSLMSMLQTFQPMVSEGKQMMQTFQTMFSPTTA
jgi:hypothetical protein